jgi:RNA polymerase sigma-70 factor, ECF subfamily
LLAAIRADLLRRLRPTPEAADAYRMAIEVAPTDAKRLYPTHLADTAATE